ncbi:MAG: MBOAT family protein [Alphaproteobacteria bacterium]|nr:MBOAT family protein [Alphaproteobacteria bacterium]
MLFNSYIFVFAFLPLTYVAYRLAVRCGSGWKTTVTILAVASLMFYGWASITFLAVFAGSMIVNGLVVYTLEHMGGRPKWWVAALGVVFNLCFIGWFKYFDFFVAQISGGEFDGGFSLVAIALPIGISFYTFQQIAYIVDSYKGLAGRYSPLKHLLFISFFPQLIAGPIVHHREMMPQFEQPQREKLNENLAIGFSIFAIGLFKKVVIADGIAPVADSVFMSASTGEPISFMVAWMGALAFSFQLYFDFSGYSDMAVGLARMFGIVLPLNFNSPYKSVSIVEFWRRWHMTLSRFLRDYLYIPLGGNRKGSVRRYANLLTVMLLAGLWHGAGWTFVLWGALHGVMLAANHLWHAATRLLGLPRILPAALAHPMGIAITFMLVTVAWVPFRAPSIDVAFDILRIMIGQQGDVPTSIAEELFRLRQAAVGFLDIAAVIASGTKEPIEYLSRSLIGDWALLKLYACAVIVFAFPNTAQLFVSRDPVLETAVLAPTNARWHTGLGWALVISLMFIIAVLDFAAVSPFLYFQF